MIDYIGKMLKAKIEMDLNQPAGVQALQMILSKLYKGEFESGKPLKESVLANEFELSRNAVREALNQVVGWGIFEYVPYCGYRVCKFSSQDILEWYEMREALEPIAARRLARARPRDVLVMMEHCLLDQEKAMAEHNHFESSIADMNFHLAVIDNCGNRRFCHLQNTSYLAASFFFNKLNQLPAHYEVAESTIKYLPPNYTKAEFDSKANELTINKHREMFEAIKNGNVDIAEALFREHARNQVQNVENMIMYYGHLDIEEVLSRQKIVLS